MLKSEGVATYGTPSPYICSKLRTWEAYYASRFDNIWDFRDHLGSMYLALVVAPSNDWGRHSLEYH